MPELPDVEIMKQYVDATALHHKIKEVNVTETRILENISKSRFSRELKGKSFSKTTRRGKHLFIKAAGRYLHMHFGMTGNVKYFKGTDDQLRHVRVLLQFANGYRLAYICQRLLGRVGLVDTIEEYIETNKLGPDVLEISPDDFQKAAQSTQKGVKSFLTDQQTMAGLGNVYADEILFQSGIHPKAAANSLDEDRLQKLYKKIHKVCDYAVNHKADPEQFGKSWLLPRRGKNETCPRCGGSIQQIKVSGRSSYLCPQCQSK